jgi:hypothetical protein
VSTLPLSLTRVHGPFWELQRLRVLPKENSSETDVAGRVGGLMLSQAVFVRKRENSADIKEEEPKRHKDKSHKKNRKKESRKKVPSMLLVDPLTLMSPMQCSSGSLSDKC